MERVMAELVNDVEGRRRVLPSVQQPRYPVASGFEYGLTRLVEADVPRMVATFEPPQSWAELPVHGVEHDAAAVDGRTLPQEQESIESVERIDGCE
jgi:hypothetical protein